MNKTIPHLYSPNKCMSSVGACEDTCLCALVRGVPQCTAPCSWVWQEQMLNPVPAARLRTQLPSNKSASPSGQWFCRPVQLFFFCPVFIPFVHYKSCPAAKKSQTSSPKVLLASNMHSQCLTVMSAIWCFSFLTGPLLHLGWVAVFAW